MVKAEGNTGAYVGGTKGISIPLMTTTGIRPAHTHTQKKATTFDWDAHTPTCGMCGQKSGTVAEGICEPCRKVVAHPETIPAVQSAAATNAEDHTPALEQPREILGKWKVYRIPGYNAPWFAKAPGCPEAPHPAAGCGCKPHKTQEQAYAYIREQLAPKPTTEAEHQAFTPEVKHEIDTFIDALPIPTLTTAAAHIATTPNDDPTYAEIRWAWIEARPHVLALIEALDTCLDPQTTEAAVSRLAAPVTPDPGPGGEANPGPAPTPKGKPGRPRRKYSDELIQAVITDYTSGLTQAQTAAQHGMTQRTVSRILTDYGIPTRPSAAHASTNGQAYDNTKKKAGHTA